jgi:hypothetical protein
MPIVMRVEVESQGTTSNGCHQCHNDFANHIGDFSDSSGRAIPNEAAKVLQRFSE